MRGSVYLALCLLVSTVAFADTECVTVDTSGWSDITLPLGRTFPVQEQIGDIHGSGMVLAFEETGAFFEDHLQEGTNNVFCVNEPNFTVATVLSQSAFEAKILARGTTAESDAAQDVVELAAAQTVLDANSVCQDPIADVEAQILALDFSSSTVIRNTILKIARCLAAAHILGKG